MLEFRKFYKNDIKEKHYVYYRDFMLDGKDGGYTIQDTKIFAKEIAEDKSLTGISVCCMKGSLPEHITENIKAQLDAGGIGLYLREYLIGNPDASGYVIRTRYENANSGGSKLTYECEENIKNFHFKNIKKIISDHNIEK